MACKCGNIDRVKKLYQQKLARDRAAAEAKANEISTEERIAAALEAQVLMSMPDEI